MAVDAAAFLERWHTIVAGPDLEALGRILAQDVTMGSPPYWPRLSGHGLVHHLLSIIIDTIEDFTYHREFISGAELALEFHGHVGELDVQGIDLITLDDEGKVVALDVMIRPESALAALRERVGPRMEAFLAGQS